MKRRLLIIPLVICSFGISACESPDETEAYIDATAEEHEGDRPEASPLVQPPEQPVDTARVSYGAVDGVTLTGYMARPSAHDTLDGEEALPGVVVVHEWWGLNDNIKAMTRRLAGQGYTALAVDLYGDRVAQESSDARQLVEEAMQDRGALLANIEAAIGYLDERGSDRVAILGWCFGGTVTMSSVVALDDRLEAAVIYYGQPVTSRQTLSTVETPILAFFGGQDSSIPADSARVFKEILEETNANSSVYLYDEAGHAFANPSGRNYVPEAAADAWVKTIDFLRDELS